MLTPRRRWGYVVRTATSGVLLGAAACFGLDDPTDPGDTSVVSLDVKEATLPANGLSSTEVTATLAEETPTGTELTFSTDAGTLTGAGSMAGKEIKVSAAGARSVSVRLIAPTTAGLATLTVRAGSGFATDTVRFAAAPPDTLELAADPARARANGQDAITVRARALRSALGEKVTEGTRVQFLVSRNGSQDFQLSGSAETDAAGQATRRLITLTPGTYRVIASAGAAGSVKADTIDVQFDPVP